MSDMFFERLTDICQELLYRDKKTFDYLKKRNLAASTIERYKIGAFPKDLRILLNAINSKELINNNIIWNASESPFKYSNVHYPIVIPIHNANNKIVGIGCRTLIDEQKRKALGIPKYKNSSYEKTSHLFGLDKAIDEIRKKNNVFVVEGYFDVISCHQAGIKNVVASCGTLFSKRQQIILSRYTENITIMLDNDEPGRISARRIKETFSKNDFLNINMKCKFTPKGFKDVDEYLGQGGSLDFFNI